MTNDRFSLTGESCDPFDRLSTQYCYALACLRAFSVCESFWDAYAVDDAYTHPVCDILDAVRCYRNKQAVPIVPRLREWSTLEGYEIFNGKKAQCAVDFVKRLLKDVSTAMKGLCKYVV